MGTDPFVKTWWFLEAYDGSWLADADHELFTRDPNAALRWPNLTHADWARQGLHHALWLKVRAATEHKWLSPTPETLGRFEAADAPSGVTSTGCPPSPGNTPEQNLHDKLKDSQG